MASFTIVHLSDLHFSEGAFVEGAYHKHSIEHLRSLEQILRQRQFDKVILTGDITNDGNPESLLRARTWLLESFEVDADTRTGLQIPIGKLGVVPGNHDAFNDTDVRHLPIEIQRQKSLENYNRLFAEFAFGADQRYRYEWIEKENSALFIVYVDTCLLGDPDLDKLSAYKHPFKYLNAIARGELLTQSADLLRLFDIGMSGQLRDPHQQGTLIGGGSFRSALKVVVAHHYLFEPRKGHSEPLLALHDVRAVFGNLASACFDVYLCGHKHIPEFLASFYGEHLDARGRGRHLMNVFRRLLGVSSLPLQIRIGGGQKESKLKTLFFTISALWYARREEIDLASIDHAEQFVDGLAAAIEEGLQDPNRFAASIREFLKTTRGADAGILRADELAELQQLISLRLGPDQKRALVTVAKRIAKYARRLGSRPFLQVVAASAAKTLSRSDRERGFFIYTIEGDDKGFRVDAEQFVWDSERHDFDCEGRVTSHVFKHRARSDGLETGAP